MQKYATFQVQSSVLVPRDATRRQLRAIAKRHHFDFTPRPGYLYVRSRAISSRTNDNYDEFPAEEIKKAYKTFIGKPVFVNHVNDNHKRARGVIIDAALHEDRLSDGSPDTWAEVLMEVDAIRFPKLAEAIRKKRIDRTSMGTDVAYSVCSACGNKASTPAEYCVHIPRLKGKKILRYDAALGGQREHLIREICYGLGFFENSLLVEPPADPTAFFLGVEDHSGLGKAASKQAVVSPMDSGRACIQCAAHGMLSCRETVGPCDACGQPQKDIYSYDPHGEDDKRLSETGGKPENLCLDCIDKGWHMESAHDQDRADVASIEHLSRRPPGQGGFHPIWKRGMNVQAIHESEILGEDEYQRRINDPANWQTMQGLTNPHPVTVGDPAKAPEHEQWPELFTRMYHYHFNKGENPSARQPKPFKDMEDYEDRSHSFTPLRQSLNLRQHFAMGGGLERDDPNAVHLESHPGHPDSPTLCNRRGPQYKTHPDAFHATCDDCLHEWEGSHECQEPYCQENGFPEGWHTQAEHMDPSHQDPGHPDYQSAEKAVQDAIGGHPEAWLLDHQSEGPTKYSTRRRHKGHHHHRTVRAHPMHVRGRGWVGGWGMGWGYGHPGYCCESDACQSDGGGDMGDGGALGDGGGDGGAMGSLTRHFAASDDQCTCPGTRIEPHTRDGHQEFAERSYAAGKTDAWGHPIKQPYDGHGAWDCNNYECTEHPQSLYPQEGQPQGVPGWLKHDTDPNKDIAREVGKAFHDQGLTEDGRYLLDQQHTGPTKYSKQASRDDEDDEYEDDDSPHDSDSSIDVSHHGYGAVAHGQVLTPARRWDPEHGDHTQRYRSMDDALHHIMHKHHDAGEDAPLWVYGEHGPMHRDGGDDVNYHATEHMPNYMGEGHPQKGQEVHGPIDEFSSADQIREHLTKHHEVSHSDLHDHISFGHNRLNELIDGIGRGIPSSEMGISGDHRPVAVPKSHSDLLAMHNELHEPGKCPAGDEHCTFPNNHTHSTRDVGGLFDSSQFGTQEHRDSARELLDEGGIGPSKFSSLAQHFAQASADRWVHCDQGHRHWGSQGAAGLLLRHTDDQGTHRYLLQHRAPWVDHGGTWSTVGGALHHGEHPVDGAVREAMEEMGNFPHGVSHVRTHTDDHGGWAYHTVIMQSPSRFDTAGHDGETGTGGYQWMTRDEMDEAPLHPGFKKSLPNILPKTEKTAAAEDDLEFAHAMGDFLDLISKDNPGLRKHLSDPANAGRIMDRISEVVPRYAPGTFDRHVDDQLKGKTADYSIPINPDDFALLHDHFQEQHSRSRELWEHAEKRPVNLADPVDLKQHMLEAHHFEPDDFWRNSHPVDHPALGPADDDDRPLTNMEMRKLHDHDHETGDYAGTTLGDSHFHQAKRKVVANQQAHCLICGDDMRVNKNKTTRSGDPMPNDGWHHADGMKRDHDAVPHDGRSADDQRASDLAMLDQARMEMRDRLHWQFRELEMRGKKKTSTWIGDHPEEPHLFWRAPKSGWEVHVYNHMPDRDLRENYGSKPKQDVVLFHPDQISPPHPNNPKGRWRGGWNWERNSNTGEHRYAPNAWGSVAHGIPAHVQKQVEKAQATVDEHAANHADLYGQMAEQDDIARDLARVPSDMAAEEKGRKMFRNLLNSAGESTCHHCDGEGNTERGPKTCGMCDGTGFLKHSSLTKTADEDQCPYCGSDCLMQNGEYVCEEGHHWRPTDPAAQAYHGEGSQHGHLQPLAARAGYERQDVPATEVADGDYLDIGQRTRVHTVHPDKSKRVLVQTRTTGTRSPSIKQWKPEETVTVWRKS